MYLKLVAIDQNTPPAAPAVYAGRDALSALAEELERRGVRMRIDDGFIAPKAMTKAQHDDIVVLALAS